MFFRTFRLFSKNRDVEEFQRVYGEHELNKNNKSDKDSSIINSNGGGVGGESNNSGEPASPTSALFSKASIINKSFKRKKRLTGTSANTGGGTNDENSCDNSCTSTNNTNNNNNNAAAGSSMITNHVGISAATSSTNVIVNSPISSTFNVITSSMSPLRPSDLRSSTIVFGLPLNIIMQRTGQPLPQKIIEAMKILRKLAPRAVGVFRKSGVKTRITQLKELIDTNEIFNFTLSYTLYDIADLIKLYFRELPECLITNRISDILLANYSSKCFTIIHPPAITCFLSNSLFFILFFIIRNTSRRTKVDLATSYAFDTR